MKFNKDVISLPTSSNVHTLARVHDLCCGCGVCSAICPMNCIEIKFDKDFQYKPFVDSTLCNYCGLCLKVCPENQKTNLLTERSFVKLHSDCVPNELIGSYLNCYVGNVSCIEDRIESTSGGLLTAVLVELLTRNLVDAVVVIGESSYGKTSKFFEAKIVENVADIHDNRGSKYYPIEYSQALKMIESKKNCRYAIVALPCVTLAIRKAQITKKLKNILYILSPVCGHGVSAAYTEFILKSSDIRPESVIKIRYRDKTNISKATDYNFVVEYKTVNGKKTKRLGFTSSIIGKIWHKYLFTPNKCFFCNDFAGELSDASFADAWLSEYMSDVNGTSLLVVRNKKIDSLIKEMTHKKTLQLSSITPEKIIEAQKMALHFKKETIKSRVRFSKLFYKNFPNYLVDWQTQSIIKSIRENSKTMMYMRLSRWLYRRKLFSFIRNLIHTL